jgi:hypothetical protein
MDVAVGDGLLGRVIDPLGRPLDGKGPLRVDRVRRPARGGGRAGGSWSSAALASYLWSVLG